jgi:vacuolar-type H+-ATPase subunit I/STV1
MNFKNAMIPIIFFIICIFGIAQSAITVKTYLDTDKEKDTNFIFSAIILTVSIFGLLGSGFMTYKALKGGAPVATNVSPVATNVSPVAATAASEVAGSHTNLGAQEMGLANQLEATAAAASTKAAKATEAARLANALGATLGQLKQKSN